MTFTEFLIDLYKNNNVNDMKTLIDALIKENEQMKREIDRLKFDKNRLHDQISNLIIYKQDNDELKQLVEHYKELKTKYKHQMKMNEKSIIRLHQKLNAISNIISKTGGQNK